MILGKDIAGQSVIKDLVNIPHLLVAGATGTGKSVGLNAILAGLLLTKTPDELKLIMIDPKRVEMTPYNGIPHLLIPIITDMELVVNALNWAIDKMMQRYRLLEQLKVKKVTEYNRKIGYTAMPYIVIVVDEMADLMLAAGKEVEPKIQRLAQMGRAVGIHLILATQKPVVDVITGLIKSNIPGRMAYAVASSMDSRVILDETGADNLLGNGDMLFKDQTMPKAIRIQGTFISTEDTEDIINQIKEQVEEDEPAYSEELKAAVERPVGVAGGATGEREPEFRVALEIVIAEGKASASLLQRRLRVGYNKASRLIEQLEEAGAISAGQENSSKPRDVLVNSVEDIFKNDSPQ
jgi:S-DNA-T family DNA segregation ATPase FtsK/SpoIIIE